jgi:hypothetical protein
MPMPMKRHLSWTDNHNASDDTWIDADNRKTKRTKNRSKKDKMVISASQPAELIDEVINAVAGDSPGDSPEIVHKCCSSAQTESSYFVEIESNVSLLESMKCELRQLKETVATLSVKIDELSKAVLAPSQPRTKPADSSYASALSAPVHSAPSTRTSRNTLGQNPRASHSSHDDQRHDPVTAMYIDLSIRKQRANNIVISGLPTAQSPDQDIKAVIDLLTVEFAWDTDLCPGVSVARCRRLGKAQEGKYQPLLVTLDSHEQAEFYVKNASLLRQSNQAAIRDNVFINPDLTPSEAKAAFEIRQRRRQRRQESVAATYDPSAFPSRTFFQSSGVNNNNHSPTVSTVPTASNHQNPVPPITTPASVNEASAGDASLTLTQHNTSPCRLVYRSAVAVEPHDDNHRPERHLQPIQPASSTCVEQCAVTNCQSDVPDDVHTPAGRPPNSKL